MNLGHENSSLQSFSFKPDARSYHTPMRRPTFIPTYTRWFNLRRILFWEGSIHLAFQSWVIIHCNTITNTNKWTFSWDGKMCSEMCSEYPKRDCYFSNLVSGECLVPCLSSKIRIGLIKLYHTRISDLSDARLHATCFSS